MSGSPPGGTGYARGMPTPDEMQKRLEELGEGIDAARRQAKDDGLLPDDEEPTLEDPDPDEPGDEGLPGHATG